METAKISGEKSSGNRHKCLICGKSIPLELCFAHRLETGHALFEPYCKITSD